LGARAQNLLRRHSADEILCVAQCQNNALFNAYTVVMLEKIVRAAEHPPAVQSRKRKLRAVRMDVDELRFVNYPLDIIPGQRLGRKRGGGRCG
jgi:hypothetical protein